MRAKPRGPSHAPFASYERPRWWHVKRSAAMHRAVRELVLAGSNHMNAILAVTYYGKGLTDDECLHFGFTRGDEPGRLFNTANSIWSKITKEPATGESFRIPVILGYRR